MTKPVRVAITGAAGNIGYQLAFRIASGQLLGEDTPIILQLIEIPPAMDALQGVVMELNDCAFPALVGIETADDPVKGFKDTDFALLVGARPRGPGMERKDLLQANAAIFSAQGKALNESANPDVKVLVVGNPATKIENMIIWGNHSSTQYPDLHHCKVDGKAALDLVDNDFYVDSYIPTVQKRGAAIIKARGASSAASAASAAIDHMRDWALGTNGKVISMAVPADGSYGIEEGIVYSYPVTCEGGDYTIVQGLDINDFSRERMDATEAELREEREGVASLLP